MTPSRYLLDSPEFRKAYPLWDGDPCALIPSTPLTDEEIEVLRTLGFTPARTNRYLREHNIRNIQPHRSIGNVAHVLRHRPSGDVAFAMMRSSEVECSSTAVLYATGEVVPIQECKTGLPL